MTEPTFASPEDEADSSRSFGARAADAIARFGGSWTFLILFAAFLAGWMILNNREGRDAFDPYPYILLNLALSTLAAIQAPIILMSQRRSEERDRARAENDYAINRRAEREVAELHAKLDRLLASRGLSDDR